MIYAVHYSPNGKLHHIRLEKYKISFKGKVQPIIKCGYPFCDYEEKIRLRGYRTFVRSCKNKVRFDTLTRARARQVARKHKAIYLCSYCEGYHLTMTKYNSKLIGHTAPIEIVDIMST